MQFQNSNNFQYIMNDTISPKPKLVQQINLKKGYFDTVVCLSLTHYTTIMVKQSFGGLNLSKLIEAELELKVVGRRARVFYVL